MSEDTEPTRDSPPYSPPDQTPGGSASPSIPSRQRIGQYEIRSVIASGGMGVVYEAFQQSPRRAVALKIMRLGLASASARERFEREAQLLARLHHPGIVQVFEAGTHQEGPDQVPFIAMELIASAQTITQFARTKNLNSRHVVELLLKVCAAVQHGNEKGILHRDLKPSNLLVDQDGHVKVIDFGVARALDNDHAAITLQTHIGQLVGTIHYMSPEQISGDSRVLDARTDVYSLGVVLFELLAGRLPFDLQGKTLAEASRIVQSDPPTKLSSIVSRIDVSLQTIVEKATARARADRYNSVQEFADDLSRWLRGEETLARAEGVFVKATRATRRWAGANRLAATLLIAIAATVIGWLSASLLVNHFRPFAPIAIRLQTSKTPPPIESFEHVRAIIINRADGTLTAQDDAAAGNIEGVTNSNVRSWRLIHAALMKKLAVSGARALVFDIHFPKNDPLSDEAMFAGIAACDKAALPLILFRPFWPSNPQVPVASTDLILADPRVVIGVGVAPQINGITEHVDFANQRGDNDPWPGLALAAWASGELGRDPIQYSLDTQKVGVVATSRQASSTGVGQVIRRIWFPVTSIQPTTVFDSVSKAQVGDITAVTTFGVPTNDALVKATVSMSDVLKMNDSQLREVFGGMIVVVADAAGDSIVTLRGGQKQRGYVVHMAAIEDVSIASRPHLVEDVKPAIAIVLASACIGLLIEICVRKLCAAIPGWGQYLAGLSFSLAAVFAICYFSPDLFGLIIHPLTALIAVAIASTCACYVFKSGGIHEII